MAYVMSSRIEQFDDDLSAEERYNPESPHAKHLENVVGTKDVYEVEIPVLATYKAIVVGATSETQALNTARGWLKEEIPDFDICCGEFTDIEFPGEG